MKMQALQHNRIADFVEYCKRHKSEVDDSFLYDEDLRSFEPNEENPTYIATDEADRIIGAASLIIDEYNRRGKKGRFRIFHSETEDTDCFYMLLKSVLKHIIGLEKLIIFIPLVNKSMLEAIEKLNFEVERFSFLLVREAKDVPEYKFPEGYEIKEFQAGSDEQTWCEVRNSGFAKLQGSETPITPEMVARMIAEDDYIEGGLMLLYNHERPVGIIRGAADEYEDLPIMNIGPLAIISEYQGKGLGRSLLRAALRFAKDKGFERTILCVNAENDRAKALYLQEGFKQVEAVACYKYALQGVDKQD